MAHAGLSRQRGTGFLAVPSLLIAAAFFLPIAVPSIFGWMNILLAVPVFFLLQAEENYEKGVRQLRNGILLAAAGAFLIGQIPVLVFSLTMVPLGYSLFLSARRREDPATAGAKGVAVLGLSWFVFWSIYGITTGVHPYASLLAMLDNTFDQIIAIYRQSPDLPTEAAYELEQIIGSARENIPKILPGLLAGSLILTVWLNQVIGSNLLIRLRPENAPWPKYASWQLPDKLVWLVIAAVGLALIGRETVRNTGYCLAIIAAVLYFFQGTAIVVHLLDRWKVPQYVRFILYLIMVVQSYGLLVLSVVGLADIWLNFRKLGQDGNYTNDTKDT
jgi:uncharacterized protein YybS (DUF2232 family)